MREINDNEKIRDEFLTILIRLSTDEVTTSRKYQKIQDTFAMVGGIIKFILIISKILIDPAVQLLYS